MADKTGGKQQQRERGTDGRFLPSGSRVTVRGADGRERVWKASDRAAADALARIRGGGTQATTGGTGRQ